MNANNGEIYQFAIEGGVLELLFKEEDVLQLVVRAAGETNAAQADVRTGADTDGMQMDADTGSNAHADTDAKIATRPAHPVTVLVEESVVSLSAYALRVIVWKHPLSVQVLTESGDWLLRVEAIQIDAGEESATGDYQSPTIRLIAERSADDVIELDEPHQNWLVHRREKALYGIRVPQGELAFIDTASNIDSYSVTTNGQALRLSVLCGSAVADLKHK